MAISQTHATETNEGLTDETQELIISLPRQRGWRTAHLYQYQGFWYTGRQLQAVVAFQKHFQAHDTDLLLVTVPKSGTTWLKALAFAILNRHRYSNSDNPLLTANPHSLVPFFEINIYDQNHAPDLTTIPSPRLFATHISYGSLPESIRNSGCRMVYLCRNPKDAFISFWHFARSSRPESLGPLPLEEAFEMFCNGGSTFGPFWDHVQQYWKESIEKPHKVLFLKYEELKEDITSQLKRLAEFLGFPFSLEEERNGAVEKLIELCSFERLKNLDVNKKGDGSIPFFDNKSFFRRGEVGDWMNHLTPSMVERLDRINEEKLCGSGLTF